MSFLNSCECSGSGFFSFLFLLCFIEVCTCLESEKCSIHFSVFKKECSTAKHLKGRNVTTPLRAFTAKRKSGEELLAAVVSGVYYEARQLFSSLSSPCKSQKKRTAVSPFLLQSHAHTKTKKKTAIENFFYWDYLRFSFLTVPFLFENLCAVCMNLTFLKA